MVGKVELFNDEDNEAEKTQAKQAAEQIRQRIVELVESHASNPGAFSGLKQLVDSFPTMPSTEDLETFSLWVAARMPLPSGQTPIEVLQTTSTLQRLQKLLHVIQGGSSAQSANCVVQ